LAGELLFNRYTRLEVGIPGQEGLVIEGLRISFEVEKTSTSTANASNISVYNLNKASRSFMEKKGLFARLIVGYKPPLDIGFEEILAVGNVAKALNDRTPPDWKTQFEIGDGETALNETAVNKSFDAGISLSSVISDVAGTFGKPVSYIKGVKDKVLKNGLSVSGAAKAIMDDITEEGDVEWSIQDDEVIVLPKSGATDDEVYVLTPETGLIGSPKKREEGIEFSSLIIPKLRPGRRVRLESQDFTGLYRIRTAKFRGDNFEGPWDCRVEAVEVGSATA